MTSLATSQACEGGSEPWACTQGGTSIAARARDGLQADAVHTLTHGSRCWDAGTHMVRLCPVGPGLWLCGPTVCSCKCPVHTVGRYAHEAHASGVASLLLPGLW